MSGNRGKGRPKGRPNKSTAEIKALAQVHGPAAIVRLVQLAGLDGQDVQTAEATQVAAIKELLDRGYGKATQMVAGDPDGDPVRAVTEIVLRGVRASE